MPETHISAKLLLIQLFNLCKQINATCQFTFHLLLLIIQHTVAFLTVHAFEYWKYVMLSRNHRGFAK